jgi:hypothetical protein
MTMQRILRQIVYVWTVTVSMFTYYWQFFSLLWYWLYRWWSNWKWELFWKKKRLKFIIPSNGYVDVTNEWKKNVSFVLLSDWIGPISGKQVWVEWQRQWISNIGSIHLILLPTVVCTFNCVEQYARRVPIVIVQLEWRMLVFPAKITPPFVQDI